MGMFDRIKFEMKCLKCGNLLNGFQSRDGPCKLLLLDFWEVNNFYEYCQKCKIFISFDIERRPNRELTIQDYVMTKDGSEIEHTVPE